MAQPANMHVVPGMKCIFGPKICQLSRSEQYEMIEEKQEVHWNQQLTKERYIKQHGRSTHNNETKVTHPTFNQYWNSKEQKS